MPATRVQLALNVEDVSAATVFYSKLFGVAAHKQRDGYANFIIADPPLKLVLIENPGAAERLNHLGIEASTSGDVTNALSRFRTAGLESTVAEQDRCCHAVQDKLFVSAPDVPQGWWEFYAVTDDDPANPGDTTSVCATACGAATGCESRDVAATGACCG